MSHKYNIEKLYHFRCYYCNKWWTIGDCTQFIDISCPWCGAKADATPEKELEE
jgi:phage FluMu protein Com